MGQIVDYKCTYDNAGAANSQVAAQLNLTFPDVYLHKDTMVELAKGVRKHDGMAVCEMPFCHTVEAEALGGIINLGDEKAGPRAKEYLTKNMEDLLNLQDIDFSKGRIHEVLLACQELENQGEPVALEVAGPFTILNVLIDARYVFKCLRKNPELAKQVMWKIGDQVLLYMEEAMKYGVKIISYADSAGGLNILGPKMAEQVVEDFTYEFLKKAQEVVKGKALLVLCPKTTFALLGTDKAILKNYQLSKEMSYQEGCVEAVGKVAMVGEVCIKKTNHTLSGGFIKEVVLQ